MTVKRPFGRPRNPLNFGDFVAVTPFVQADFSVNNCQAAMLSASAATPRNCRQMLPKPPWE
jgi:hypothetical protein